MKKRVWAAVWAVWMTVSLAVPAGARSMNAHNPLTQPYEQLVLSRTQSGEVWELAWEDLSSGLKYSYNGYAPVQSASVIKVFIMAAVYDRICFPAQEEEQIFYSEQYEGELRSLLEQMITVSDNEAANRLISILGEGDTGAGMRVVNDFCQEHGFSKTHLGRKFLESAPADDNYTCAADCRRILSEIYHGTLVSEEASGKMLGLLQGQTVRHKIPSGLPEGYQSANKTGEMPEGYGLGCIENDIAIVFPPDGSDYILTVLSSELAGNNAQAQQVIASISGMVAAGE